MRAVAVALDDGDIEPMILRDVNGNTVGRAEFVS